MDIRQAFTFDDVLLTPGSLHCASDRDQHTDAVDACDRSRHTADLRRMGYGHRIGLAIAMAQGRRARRHPPQHGYRTPGRRGPQGQEVRGRMVVNPLTIHPDETLADALRLMADHKISAFRWSSATMAVWLAS